MLPSRTRVWTLVLLVTATSLATAADTSGWQTDFNQAREQAQRLNRPLLLHFSASYCGPCRKMAATTMQDAAVLASLRTDVVGMKIDVQQSPQLANRFGIQSIPSDIFIDPHTGNRIIESNGYQTGQQYVRVMSRAADRYTEAFAKTHIVKNSQSQATPRKGAPGQATRSQPVGTTSDSPTTTPTSREPRLALDGYSPVSLWRDREWTQGSTELTAIYRGQRFRLASEKQLETFNANPRKYAPRLLSCDPVVLWETNRAVIGSTRFGAFYDDELFLFSSDANRKRFKGDPERFTRTRVVLDIDQIEESVVR